MQMVLILQECGMRISELLQLPLDCLTQDARGTFYLRFMQGKMKRKHTIASANGWTRQIEMNERKRNNLVNIVTSLERTHA